VRAFAGDALDAGGGDVLVLVMNGREEDQVVEEEDIECLEYARTLDTVAYSRHSPCIEPEGSRQPVARAA
jgi:hypothetical protein